MPSVFIEEHNNPSVSATLKYWYPFNSSLNDSSGNSYNLSAIGGSSYSYTSAVNGVGNGIDCNKVSCTTGTGDRLNINLDLSVAFWIYPKTLDNNDFRFTAYWDRVNTFGTSIGLSATDATMASSNGTNLSTWDKAHTLSTGSWQHIIITYQDSQKRIAVYKNNTYLGVAASATAYNALDPLDSTPYILGTNSMVSSPSEGCRIADLRIYSGLLTSDDRLQVYKYLGS